MNVPKRVQRALEASRQGGFDKNCTPEVGSLLALLAAAAGPGTVAELGTGCGVGSAWLLSGLREGGRFVGVDANPAHHRVVTELFGDVPNTRFLCGDWREALPYGPFSLIFVDVGEAKDAGAAAVVEALALSGIVVLDDFTPEALWPLEWRGKPDARREFWLRHPRLRATEILTTPETAAILAVRVR
jgi:predicted O-methyltransferase YrrM